MYFTFHHTFCNLFFRCLVFLINNKVFVNIQQHFCIRIRILIICPSTIIIIVVTLIIHHDIRDDLCVCVRYIDFRATGNTARRRPGDVTYTRYCGWVGCGCITSIGTAVCVRGCARTYPYVRDDGSGHGIFRPRRTPLFHLLFIQKPTVAGLALARIVSLSSVSCTLTSLPS